MDSPLTDPSRQSLLETYLDHRPQLIRFFSLRTHSRETAEDIVQDIALRLQGLAPSILADIEAPLAFIYRIGVNLMLDRIKQSRRRRDRDQHWTDTQVSHLNGTSLSQDPDPEQAASARQQLARVRTIVATLGPQCRRAFQLHKFEGLTHGEVAATLGISRSAVEKHISHALKVILREIGQGDAK